MNEQHQKMPMDSSGSQNSVPSGDQENKPTGIIRETAKNRPINSSRLARRTITTICMALLFALVSCLTFVILEPILSRFFNPDPEETVAPISFPDEENEMLPEDMMLSDDTSAGAQDNLTEQQVEQQVEEILSNTEIPVNADSYAKMISSLHDVATLSGMSMVTVTGTTTDTDWFNNPYENSGSSSGVMIADNSIERLILVKDTPIKNAERIFVTLSNGNVLPASLKQTDTNTGLSIVAVSHGDFTAELLEQYPVISIGSSMPASLTGRPVIAIGSPMGTDPSICYGIVTASTEYIYMTDINYRRITTDIYGSLNASGILINLAGELVGIIDTSISHSDNRNSITALGINELKPTIEKLSNASPISMLGVTGRDVPPQIHSEQNVPYGAFITGITMDSPAMRAGIQSGDIITAIDGNNIGTFRDLTLELLSFNPESVHEITLERQHTDGYRSISFSVTMEGQAK